MASNLEDAHKQKFDELNREKRLICNICNNPVTRRNAFTCTHCCDIVHKNECMEEIEGQRFCRTCSEHQLARRNATQEKIEDWGGFGELQAKKKKES